jgi:hypothetical protein
METPEQSPKPEETIQKLIELLIEADPDTLLEQMSGILTPEQLWRAAGEDMATAIQYGNGRLEVTQFLIATNCEDFIVEEPKGLPAEIVDSLIEEHPGPCLEYIKSEMSDTQKRRAAELDPITAVAETPELVDESVIPELIQQNPGAVLMHLHEKLDEATFQKLAFDNPVIAWASDTKRLNRAFFEEHLVRRFSQNRGDCMAWRMTKEQIQYVVDYDPQFAWEEFRKILNPEQKNLIPKWERKKDNPETSREQVVTEKIPKLIWIIIAILIGIVSGLLTYMALDTGNKDTGKTPENPEVISTQP